MLDQSAYPPPTSMVDVAPSTDPERLTIPWSTWTIYPPKPVLFSSCPSVNRNLYLIIFQQNKVFKILKIKMFVKITSPSKFYTSTLTMKIWR